MESVVVGLLGDIRQRFNGDEKRAQETWIRELGDDA